MSEFVRVSVSFVYVKGIKTARLWPHHLVSKSSKLVKQFFVNTLFKFKAILNRMKSQFIPVGCTSVIDCGFCSVSREQTVWYPAVCSNYVKTLLWSGKYWNFALTHNSMTESSRASRLTSNVAQLSVWIDLKLQIASWATLCMKGSDWSACCVSSH